MSNRESERREYEADVFYEAWRRGYNPDNAVACAYDCYYEGKAASECVQEYAERVEQRREIERNREEDREPR